MERKSTLRTNCIKCDGLITIESGYCSSCFFKQQKGINEKPKPKFQIQGEKEEKKRKRDNRNKDIIEIQDIKVDDNVSTIKKKLKTGLEESYSCFSVYFGPDDEDNGSIEKLPRTYIAKRKEDVYKKIATEHIVRMINLTFTDSLRETYGENVFPFALRNYRRSKWDEIKYRIDQWQMVSIEDRVKRIKIAFEGHNAYDNTWREWKITCSQPFFC